MDQYRFDRNPSPKGQNPEPLLSFPNGALVHFAVSNCEVRMTTRLEGTRTRFLPFNLGDNGAAGNPLNPNGHPTAYLWEQVWQRDSWLEILGRYLVAERDDKKNLKTIIFPRYHQLDVTRKLQAAILAEGPGQKYLIQHSAGSGKTNSIAWSAHFLADLHDADNKKVFDTVLVISDRNVIDSQLQEAIFGFERTTGVVATIKGDGGSKSSEHSMRQAIEEGVILDVLQNYRSYKLAFKLATAHEPLGASRGLRSDGEHSPAASALPLTEVEVVEHFRETVAPLLDGKAKAMVVVGNRLEAVRWQLAINKYIKDKGYPLTTVVAFSGEVDDKESGPEPFKLNLNGSKLSFER